MARASTRQTFVTGQTVFVHAYQAYWRKALVVEPDVTQKALGSTRDIHYVKVNYFDREGKQVVGAEWRVLNSRTKISDQAAYDLVLKGKEIERLQGDVRQYESWEMTHTAYLEQAKIIQTTATMGVSLGLGKDVEPPSVEGIEELALYLRSVFTLKDKRTRELHGVEDVVTQRRELSQKADAANKRMQALGVKVWS